MKWDYEKGTVQLLMPGYVRAEIHSLQHEKPKIPQDSLYSWTQPIKEKNNQMPLEKAPTEKLDDNNQNRL